MYFFSKKFLVFSFLVLVEVFSKKYFFSGDGGHEIVATNFPSKHYSTAI